MAQQLNLFLIHQPKNQTGSKAEEINLRQKKSSLPDCKSLHMNLKTGLSAIPETGIKSAAYTDFTQAHLTPMLIGAETLIIRP